MGIKAFCITLYNEFLTVTQTIKNIKDYFGDNCYIVVVQSESKLDYKIESNYNSLIKLSNLAEVYDSSRVAAHAICRNYSVGFSHLYDTNIIFDYIVALCADTLVVDPNNFNRRYEDMKRLNKYMCISQAIGQNFHASDSNPLQGKEGGRFQHENTTDFMPQFFMIRGKEAIEKRVFSNINITNEFTSEQCLGDEFVSKFGHFEVIRLARNAYDYNDGIRLQYK